MKKTTLSVLAFMLVGLIAVGAVSAFGGWGRNAAADQALESGNYQEWRSAMIDDLTEERFQQMQEMHTKMQQRRAQMPQDEMEAAIESGDFDAWKTLMETRQSNRPNAPQIELTQETFDKWVQMHEAQQSGDNDTAQELREELGLGGKGPDGRGHGGMGRFGGDCPLAE